MHHPHLVNLTASASSRHFGLEEVASTALDAVLAFMPSVPNWAYNGAALGIGGGCLMPVLPFHALHLFHKPAGFCFVISCMHRRLLQQRQGDALRRLGARAPALPSRQAASPDLHNTQEILWQITGRTSSRPKCL